MTVSLSSKGADKQEVCTVVSAAEPDRTEIYLSFGLNLMLKPRVRPRRECAKPIDNTRFLLPGISVDRTQISLVVAGATSTRVG